jgi:hypothetical protein
MPAPASATASCLSSRSKRCAPENGTGLQSSSELIAMTPRSSQYEFDDSWAPAPGGGRFRRNSPSAPTMGASYSIFLKWLCYPAR